MLAAGADDAAAIAAGRTRTWTAAEHRLNPMRYAIYFLPSTATALWRFGASVLGYDAYTRGGVAHPDHALFGGTSSPAWVAEPQRYGFHATLKAPFELADGKTEAELRTLAHTLAVERKGFVVPGLRVAAISRFVALVPAGPCPELADLANTCVRHFESLRAPLGEADRRRRLAADLSPRQAAYLETWGYPYVMEEFRFHMTLAGPLARDELAVVQSALAGLWAPVAGPMPVDAIALVAQPVREARFAVLELYPFTG